MNRPRVFLDSGVLIEGLVSPWSAARGVLILGRAALLTFVVAEIVVEETERALVRKVAQGYGGVARLRDDFRLLLTRLRLERVPHVSRDQFEAARQLIRHANDVPVLAAAMEVRPDWLLTGNTKHFTVTVARRTRLRIVTPTAFLEKSGAVLSSQSSARGPARTK